MSESSISPLTGAAGRAGPPSDELARVTVGKGPDVVLLHGGAGSWTHWTRNLAALSRRFRVWAFDLPGFGDSPAFPDTADDDVYFEWVAREIRTLIPRPVRLVGFSFGGSVAAAVAPLLAAQLRALTLVAPGSFGVPPDRKLALRPVRMLGAEDSARLDAARHNLAQVMFANPEAADEIAVKLHLDNIDRARFNSRRLSWQDRLERDLAPVTASIQVIWGSQDRMASPSPEARALRCLQMRPSIRVDLIPGAGHWVQYERSSAFDAVLLQFLEGIPEPGRSTS